MDHLQTSANSRTHDHDDSNEDYQVDADEINPKNVKSSADSGLGSTEIVDEQQHWRNGIFKPSFFIIEHSFKTCTEHILFL